MSWAQRLCRRTRPKRAAATCIYVHSHPLLEAGLPARGDFEGPPALGLWVCAFLLPRLELDFRRRRLRLHHAHAAGQLLLWLPPRRRCRPRACPSQPKMHARIRLAPVRWPVPRRHRQGVRRRCEQLPPLLPSLSATLGACSAACSLCNAGTGTCLPAPALPLGLTLASRGPLPPCTPAAAEAASASAPCCWTGHSATALVAVKPMLGGERFIWAPQRYWKAA